MSKAERMFVTNPTLQRKEYNFKFKNMLPTITENEFKNLTETEIKIVKMRMEGKSVLHISLSMNMTRQRAAIIFEEACKRIIERRQQYVN